MYDMCIGISKSMAFIFLGYIFIHGSLNEREINLSREESLSLLFILYLSTLWVEYFFDSTMMIRAEMGIFIMILVSITDIKERFVFDRDIFCGIIIEIGIIIIGMIIYNRSLFETCFFEGYIGPNSDLVGALFGMVFMLILGMMLRIYNGGFGMGDVLFFIFTSSFLNFLACLFVFFASFTSCLAYIIVYKIIKKDFEGGLIAFTPFISIGMIIFWCILVFYKMTII